MPPLDFDGLDALAGKLTAAADSLRTEAARCSRALAGLEWVSGVRGEFEHLVAAALQRADTAADEIDRIAAGLRRQDSTVHAAMGAVGHTVREAEHLAGTALRSVEGWL